MVLSLEATIPVASLPDMTFSQILKVLGFFFPLDKSQLTCHLLKDNFLDSLSSPLPNSSPSHHCVIFFISLRNFVYLFMYLVVLDLFFSNSLAQTM